jgi:TPR repeat protein
MLYVTGTGVAQDVDEGLSLLTKSADSGYYEAQYYLGKLFMEGKYVKKNIQRAKKYLSMAARQGDPDAKALLEKIRVEKIR